MAPIQPTQEYINSLYWAFVQIAIGVAICSAVVCLLTWWIYRKGQASVVVQLAEDICKESARVNGNDDDAQ